LLTSVSNCDHKPRVTSRLPNHLTRTDNSELVGKCKSQNPFTMYLPSFEITKTLFQMYIFVTYKHSFM